MFSGPAFHIISPLSFVDIMFARCRGILPLPLLVCCSQLMTQLSTSMYGLWTLLLTYLYVGPSIASLLVWRSLINRSSSSWSFYVSGSSLCPLQHTCFLTMWYIVLAYPLWYFTTVILALHHSSRPSCGRSSGLQWHYCWLPIHSQMAKPNTCIIPWSRFLCAFLPSNNCQRINGQICLGVWSQH